MIIVCSIYFVQNRNIMKEEIRTIDDLKFTTIGVDTYSVFDAIAKEKIPNVKINYYDSMIEEILSLRNGKISAFMTDEALASDILRYNEDLYVLEEPLQEEEYAYALSLNKKSLKEDIDKILDEMEREGILENLKKKWLGEDENLKIIEKKKLTGEKGTIKFGTLATSAPFAYLKDEEIVGYDIEIMYYICEKLGYKLDIEVMNWSGLLTAVSTEKVDIAGCSIIVTEERKKSVLFTKPNYYGKVVAVSSKKIKEKENTWLKIRKDFFDTFLKENRYKLFLNGFQTTIIISVLSVLLGSIIGIVLGIIRISKHRILNIISKILIGILQGTPITVLLLIMYYLVFINTDFSAIVVSIITFSIYFSTYVAEMIRSGYRAIHYNQIQASYALGFTKFQTWIYIAFPQILNYVLPVYKGEVISIIKSTSIVGYIAIIDLTKAGDMIRSRTYDAFLSLIVVAIMYLIICYSFEKILDFAEKKLNSRKGRKNAYCK